MSTFVHVKLDTSNKKKMHRTEAEEILIKEIVWLDPKDALKRLKVYTSKVDEIVQRRDEAALIYYLRSKNFL